MIRGGLIFQIFEKTQSGLNTFKTKNKIKLLKKYINKIKKPRLFSCNKRHLPIVALKEKLEVLRLLKWLKLLLKELYHKFSIVTILKCTFDLFAITKFKFLDFL